MAKPLSKLERINLTTINFDGLIVLLRDAIEHDEDFSVITDFLDSNAGKVLAEFFAFFTSQILKKIDIASQEAFISTARQNDSVLKLLKLIGARIESTAAAKVDLTMQINPSPARAFNLPVRHTITTTDLNGENVDFEVLDSKDDYTTSVFRFQL